MREHDIQNEIRLAVDPYMIVFRANVGKVRLDNGRWFDTGLPRGFSDLFGVRRSDGRAVFIEVKNEKGKTSKYQDNFLERMRDVNAICGVARSGEEAIKIVTQ